MGFPILAHLDFGRVLAVLSRWGILGFRMLPLWYGAGVVFRMCAIAAGCVAQVGLIGLFTQIGGCLTQLGLVRVVGPSRHNNPSLEIILAVGVLRYVFQVKSR